MYGQTFGLHDGKSVMPLHPGSGRCFEPFDHTTFRDLPCTTTPQHFDAPLTNTFPSPPGTHTLPKAELSFREETIGVKKVFICTFRGCNKRFSRRYNLNRHRDCVHHKSGKYKCRRQGCERTLDGFPRRDKRDEHERTPHRRQ